MNEDESETLVYDTEPVVKRNGDLNVAMQRMKKQRSRYMMDMYTTIVDAQWRYTLLVFTSGFLLSWLFFGFIWYVIIKVHGDDIPENYNQTDWIPCILNCRTFVGAFLFSLESQHTIGYGLRVPTEECPFSIFMLCAQSITGVILQAFMAGVMFAKLTRSKARANTLLFSRKAVVCMRDNNLVLMFRVADLRKSLIVGANVKAQLIQPRNTAEGEQLNYHMTMVKVGNDDYSDDLLFIWPITIVHIIDEESPFYWMDASSMLNEKFEMIVYLEGTSESTGCTMQARHSYRNSDVLWGHRFVQTVQYNQHYMNYVIDFEKFDQTIDVPTPLVSARDWEQVTGEQAPTDSQEAMQLLVFNPQQFNPNINPNIDIEPPSPRYSIDESEENNNLGKNGARPVSMLDPDLYNRRRLHSGSFATTAARRLSTIIPPPSRAEETRRKISEDRNRKFSSFGTEDRNRKQSTFGRPWEPKYGNTKDNIGVSMINLNTQQMNTQNMHSNENHGVKIVVNETD